MLAASNDVLFHALGLAAGYRCALQIHAESGPCADIVDMARVAGMTVERVVKHYGSPETPLHPSLVARHEAVPVLAREHRPFTMESDFMDEKLAARRCAARNPSPGSQRNSSNRA